MKAQHRGHQASLILELLSLLTMVSVPALLLVLKQLNPLSQRIQAYHMPTILHNRHRRS